MTHPGWSVAIVAVPPAHFMLKPVLVPPQRGKFEKVIGAIQHAPDVTGSNAGMRKALVADHQNEKVAAKLNGSDSGRLAWLRPRFFGRIRMNTVTKRVNGRAVTLDRRIFPRHRRLHAGRHLANPHLPQILQGR